MNVLKGVAEYFTPVLTSSAFLEKGVLTPEEFVAAGDALVHKCPTWSWEKGDPSKAKSYLPADKQFLITKQVPCLKRVSALESTGDVPDLEVEGEDGEDGWLSTAGTPGPSSEAVPDIPSIGDDMSVDQPGGGDEDIPDMEDFEEDGIADDVSTMQHGYIARTEPDDNDIVRTRTYDLHMTYDKYYQTPRIWLFGYNEASQPLTPEQIFEDVSQDHAKKTVTMDPHPHLGLTHASIHPCKHSAVMKKIIDHLAEGGIEARVDQYLFLFLKFIQAVIPTIEYDYTIQMNA